MALAHIHNLIFNCTPAQFATAASTTLPGGGFTVVQAPNPANGLVILTTVHFTANVVTGTMTLGAPSSTAGLGIGMALADSTTAGNILAGTTITQVTPTLTMSQNGQGIGTGDTLIASGGTLQLDFSYDGAFFLRFFGANPNGQGYDTNPGVTANQINEGLVTYLTTLFAGTLGAPISSARAVPPYNSNNL